MSRRRPPAMWVYDDGGAWKVRSVCTRGHPPAYWPAPVILPLSLAVSLTANTARRRDPKKSIGDGGAARQRCQHPAVIGPLFQQRGR